MPQPEYPDFESRAMLADEEITGFAERNIWPAARYFWGPDFRDPEKLIENEAVWTPLTSPNGEDTVTLSFYLQDENEPDFEPDDDDYEPELVLMVEMEVLRPDLMDISPKACKGLNIWECLAYRFPVDGDLPRVESYYYFENAKGKKLIQLSKAQEEFMDYLDDSDEFSLDRDSRLDFQDCIDIHNILLALEVDEKIIDLHGHGFTYPE